MKRLFSFVGIALIGAILAFNSNFTTKVQATTYQEISPPVIKPMSLKIDNVNPFFNLDIDLQSGKAKLESNTSCEANVTINKAPAKERVITVIKKEVVEKKVSEYPRIKYFPILKKDLEPLQTSSVVDRHEIKFNN